MKRMSSVLVCLVILLGSCQPATNPTSITDLSPASSLGEITITLAAQNSRSLTNATASSLTDTYEIFAYSQSTNVTYNATASMGSNRLSVPAGTYSIVALAGKLTTPYPVLLGTAKVSGVVVVSGTTSTVNLVLNHVTQSITCPLTATVNSNFNVVQTYDSNIAGLTPFDLGAGATGAFGSVTTITSVGSVSTISTKLTAPSSTAAANVVATTSGSFHYTDGILSTNLFGGNFVYHWVVGSGGYFNSEATIPGLSADLRGTIDYVATNQGTTSVTITWGV